MTWKVVCSSSDVPANTLRRFVAGGVPLLIANYGGAFRALPPVCPHMEEPLEESGVIAHCVLTCTKHLWAWNLASMTMIGETAKELQQYDVKEEDGNILVLVDKELVYEFEEDGADDDFFK